MLQTTFLNTQLLEVVIAENVATLYKIRFYREKKRRELILNGGLESRGCQRGANVNK